ncbi:MAG: DUF4080 domain-containing protein [Desulfuromonadales bacterium]
MRTLLVTLHSKFIHNSLALPCLAASCGDGCGELLIREFTVHEPRASVLSLLLAEQPDVIAFSVYLWNRRETLDLVDALSVARPNLRIVLGGPEVSFEDDTLFHDHPGLTALVRGEGEEPLRSLLHHWAQGRTEEVIPRTLMRTGETLVQGPESLPLADLDAIPSPFQNGLVDLSRGFVYYETSRGCPFACSFCLSARDNRVRSYSMNRIRSDLHWLMAHQVAKVKLVDRTFNYDAARAREIFRFILRHNQQTHFHFEIAGHLLDDETLTLLASVPPGMFQFEIGVQSTDESTLDTIGRHTNLDRLEKAVQRLRRDDRIHLHLDLVAGLPGDDRHTFRAAIDRILALRPHHLQIEPVKLLPGSPLREQATSHRIRFDPNPPYTILSSADLTFSDLQRLQDISRLIDLLYNSGCFSTFLEKLARQQGSLTASLEWLTAFWRREGLFRFPISRQAIFAHLVAICREISDPGLVASLAYDYARCERVVPSRIPDFFDTGLDTSERQWVRDRVAQRTTEIRGQGIKLQYFAAHFAGLPDAAEPAVHLFLYLTRTGKKMQIEEYRQPRPGGE